MKRIMCALALLSIIVLLCCGCDSHKGQVQIAGVWVDEEEVAKFTQSFNELEARDNGDTYCKACDKFIEGKVRICPYCGQYI